MADPQKRFKELLARLKERDYRLTPQRVAMLQLLAGSRNHPSAAQLYEKIKEQFPTTSPATVYKTLNLLKEMGEVLELGFSTDDNRYDGNNPNPHPHLVCIRCHEILDPEVNLLQSLEQEVADISGYKIVGHRLDFYGICPKCKSI